jgi:hypothetical protein
MTAAEHAVNLSPRRNFAYGHLLRILPDDAMQAILLGGPIVKPEEPPMKGLFD